jgi:hypothetical protein
MTHGALYSNVEPLEPEWLWDNLIIAGDLSLIVGIGGIGKGRLMADIIARVTRGWDMPDGIVTGPAGSVVMITPEDHPHYTVRPRLDAAGADLSKVLDLTMCGAEGGSWMITPRGLSVLRQAVVKLGDCRLVVIDPLMSVTPVSLSNNVTVRTRVIGPLQALAADLGVAVVLVHHPVKSGSVGGSQAIVDAPRVVNMIEVDPDNEEVRILRPIKANLINASQAPVVRFTIEGSWPDVGVRYLTAPDQTLDEPEINGEPKPGGGQAAILGTLRADGPQSGPELTTRTGLPNLTVRVYLSRLKDAGLVSSPQRGLYEAVTSNNAVTSLFNTASL